MITKRRQQAKYFNSLAKVQIKKKLQKQQESSITKLRQVHLTEEQYQQKIASLEQRIENECIGPENRNKRKRLYRELVQLRKNSVLIDPQNIIQKKQQDQEKRVQKKLQRKEEIVKQIKQDKQKDKNKTCLICKQMGHSAANCRENQELIQDEIKCYNCGSYDHRLKDCPKPKSNNLQYAKCFVCKQEGHISRDCPQNPKGLYAFGGGCYICNSTTHIQKDCPKNPRNRILQQKNREENEEFFSD